MSPVARSFVAALAIGLAAAGASAQTIEEGPVVNSANGHLYYLIRNGTLAAKRNFAHSLGGELATVNNLDEQNWLYAEFAAGLPNGTSVLLGLTDEAVEGTFAWMDGEPVNFTFWQPGEPNDADAGEDYTVFHSGQPLWVDRNASSGEYAIVEVENNGACIGARDITVPGVVLDTLHNAEGGPTSCGGYTSPRVWFTFIGSGRLVSLSTCDGATANFDTVIAAFRGNCGALTCVEESDDAGCGHMNLGSRVTFYAEAGQRYYVAVMDAAANIGSALHFQLTATEDTTISPTLAFGPVTNSANGHHYFRSTADVWHEQFALARSIEGHLVTINDDAENTWVANNMIPFAGRAFIGFNDRAVEGTFVWPNGETPSFTRWAPGEPNNAGDEDATQLQRSDRLWNDVQVGASLPAVIEVTNSSCYGATPLSVPSSASGAYTPEGLSAGEFTACADPFAHGRGIWYRITGNGATVGANTCSGVTDFDTTLRVFTGDCGTLSCIAASDDGCGEGTTRSRIDFYADLGRTYYIVVGSFRDEFWGGNYTLNISTTMAPTPSVTARSAVNRDDCSRYYALTSTNFLRAQAFAQSSGMNLATISSADDNAFVRDFASGAGLDSAWIGFTDVGVAEGQYGWVDGAAVSYTNWAPGEPNGGGQEFFAAIFADGLWNDVSNINLPGIAEAPLNPDIGGRIRGALSFNSPDDGVRLLNSAFIWPGDFTIECWFRTSGDGVIFGQKSAFEDSFVPMISVGNDGLIRVAEWGGSVPASFVSGPFVADGAWRHVAFVHSGTTMILFLDGAIVASRSISQSSYESMYTYTVGTGYTHGWPGHDGDIPDTFDGDIDELRIWSGALSLSEITALKDTRYFNPALYPNLVVHLDLDDAGGRIAFDDKSGRHGRLEGSPVWLYESRNGDKIPDVCQPDCPADIDGNGVVNSTDVSEFINIWFADQTNGTLNADFNRDGTSNSTDVSDMINAYFEASGDCLV